ncbi:uncharacterized protein LOC110881597 [Helianthus annuus]|uniref:uncharacterized protein LOC110881597 n=1 Tax=Helianthus annuus TaxID=4232 RepID=UPI000B8FB83C|nr:uncharacterized protein LOC110881597 [Helianthus annuus]
MPKYAKFLKDLLSNKKKLEEISIVTLGEECSAVVQNKLPQKMTDPGSFTIPCLFGSSSVSHALADLGASINLMPYSIYSKLDLGEPVPTRMSIQLADRSVKYPRGIVENVLVKVEKFVFPVDFVILDMKEDEKVPLILGRPFLATAKALIDVFDGKLTLRVGSDTVTFEIKESMQHIGARDDTLYFIDFFMSHVGDSLRRFCGGEHELDSLEESLVEQEAVVVALASETPKESEESVENEIVVTVEKPSVESPPLLELKKLPDHIEYAFLDDEARLPVIISSDLTSEEKKRLVDVLRDHKRAIAWKLVDIEGRVQTRGATSEEVEPEHVGGGEKGGVEAS